MKKLTKFALRIFLYGFSPVLMSGSELPGSTGTKSVFNDLEDIWVPLSITDFSTSAKKFKDLKKIAQDTGEIKDWENVADVLVALLQNSSIIGQNRLSILINLAVVAYIVKNFNWVNAVLDQADSVIKENRITSNTLLKRVEAAREKFINV